MTAKYQPCQGEFICFLKQPMWSNLYSFHPKTGHSNINCTASCDLCIWVVCQDLMFSLATQTLYQSSDVGHAKPALARAGTTRSWAVKKKGRHDANFVVTGDTGGCRYDNRRCRQGRQSWHHDDSQFFFSVPWWLFLQPCWPAEVDNIGAIAPLTFL